MKTPDDSNPAPTSDAGGAGEIPKHQNHNNIAGQIERFLRVIFRDGDVFEVRAPKCLDKPGSSFLSTLSGYYTHGTICKAAADIAALDARGVAPGIYITINPVVSSVLARAANQIKAKAQSTTQDSEVRSRCWLLLDFDPVRPAGISSTDAELAAAWNLALRVNHVLATEGWPEPVVVMSGNGVHLLYRIDLPTEDAGLVARVLEGLAERFDADRVKIDRGVANAARITKVAGTMARKGDSLIGGSGTEDRPHRRSQLISVPATLVSVPTDLLDAVAAAKASAAPSLARSTQVSAVARASDARAAKFDRFDHTPDGVRGYLEARGVTITSRHEKGVITWFHLDKCPVVPDCTSTAGSDISVGVRTDGTIFYRNQHNRGTGLKWIDVREALEPGYKVWAQNRPVTLAKAVESSAVAASESWAPPLPLSDGRSGPAFPIAQAFPAALNEIRDFVLAVAEHGQVPVDAPGMLLLPMVSVSIASKLEIDPGGWKEVSAVWTLVLMNSAERKSATLAQMRAPLDAWEQEQAEELGPLVAREHTEYEIDQKRLNSLRDTAAKGKANAAEARQQAVELAEELQARKLTTIPRVLSTEPTPEALSELLAENMERALITSAEGDAFDVLMGRYNDSGQPNMGPYLNGHCGDPCRIHRKGRPPLVLHRPALSMAMIVQPEAVRGMFSNRAAAGRGLLARFVPVLPASKIGSRKIRTQSVPLPLASRYERSIRWLMKQSRPSTGAAIVTLNPGAQDIFDQFRATVEPELGRGGNLHAQQAWAGKFPGTVARIALALHALQAAINRNGSLLTAPVGLDTMHAALAFAPYLIDHERQVNGVVGISPAVNTADRILAWLEKTSAPIFTRRDCFTAVRTASVTEVSDLDPALRLLVDHGYIRHETAADSTGTPGRKPSPVYAVNPLWKRQAGPAGGAA